MYQLCIEINGKRHCFPVPLLVDRTVIHRPEPPNYPDLDLAVTVLELSQVVPKSEFSQQLSELATRFVHQVQKGLPQGVNLVREKLQEAA